MQPLHCPSNDAATPGDRAATPQDPKRSQSQSQSRRKSRYIPRSFVQHNYHDRSNELPDCVHPAAAGVVATTARGGISTLFPQKLHAVLDRMSSEGLGDVCSWQPHGRAFVVHKSKDFEAVMPRYFGKMKMSSFQRQLNLYGFMRLTHGPDKGGYYHELFLRDRYYLTRKIQRCRIKGNGSRSATNPDAEPNFYAMPKLGPVPSRAVAMMAMAVAPPLPPPPPPAPRPAAAPRRSAPAPPVVPTRVPSSAPSERAPPLGPPRQARQVSLIDRDDSDSDFLMSLPLENLTLEHEPDETASQQQQQHVEEKHGLEELDEKFWRSMEVLLENTDEPAGDVDVGVGLSLNEMEDLESTDIEPVALDVPIPALAPSSTTPAAPERPIFPKPPARVSTTVLDDEVTDFLKTMFQKEEPPSSSSSSSAASAKTPALIKKGISTAGGANAVAYAQRNAFRRRRSACNAAA